jgi:hypothetical protein
MLYSIGGIGTFLHDADAASREWDGEGSIAVPIELASKGEPGVREKPDCEDWLLKSRCIIEMLGEAL